MELSVVIPAFNEEAVIERTIKHVNDYLFKENIQGEIIVVNDGSTDKMADKLVLLQQSFKNLIIINLPKNLGKGAACRNGFYVSSGDWCILMDADESTKIETWNVFKPFCKSYDIIIGSRAVKNARILQPQFFLKVLAGKLGNKWIKLITGLTFNDTQCGFKAFNARTKTLLKYANINNWAFDIEWLCIARKLGFRVYEAPVEWKNDTSSLVKPFDYIKVLFEVIFLTIRIKRQNIYT